MKRVADEVLGKSGLNGQKYLIGTMIEIPRAALLADQMAKEAEFFSFGTNDLTPNDNGSARSFPRTTKRRRSSKTTRSACWIRKAWAC